MPSWEYEKIDLNSLPRNTDEIDLLNDAGKEGWELVAITPNNIAYVKREVAAATAAASAPRKASAASTRTRASSSS
jgi:hypothetical protein